MAMESRKRHFNNCKELLAEKRRLSELAQKKKICLDGHLEYFQKNAGSILFSAVSYHLILKRLPVIGDYFSQREKDDDTYLSSSTVTLQKAGAILSIIWKVIRPVVVSMALKHLRNFFEKRK